MENYQALVLSTKLKYLDEWNRLRREKAEFYNEHLKEIEEITLPSSAPYSFGVYHLYVIRTSKRENLRCYLREKGISVGVHYPLPLHLQKSLRFLHYRKGDFPVSEEAAEKVLSLPLFPKITSEEMEYVVSAVKEFFGF